MSSFSTSFSNVNAGVKRRERGWAAIDVDGTLRDCDDSPIRAEFESTVSNSSAILAVEIDDVDAVDCNAADGT